jgi:hypothetical protein
MKRKEKFFVIAVVCGFLAMTAGCTGPVQPGMGMSDILIESPVDQVFKNMCERNPFAGQDVVKRMNASGPTCEVGANEDQVYTILGQTYKIHIILVDLVPDQKAVFKFTGDFNGTVTWLTVPEGDNTRLYCIFEVAAPLPPGMSYDSVKGQVQKAMDDLMVTVKNNVGD